MQPRSVLLPWPSWAKSTKPQAWLDLATKKHVDYLLPYALTPSGTNDQSSNFWASTLQYRIFFCDPLKRVTGRDLFAEFPRALPGRIALAAVAAGQPASLQFNENNRSVLVRPVLRPDQLLVSSAACIWHVTIAVPSINIWHFGMNRSARCSTRVTSRRIAKKSCCFVSGRMHTCGATQASARRSKTNLPYSFEFPEPEVNEVYLRSSYERGGIVVGMKKGGLIVHAGGRTRACRSTRRRRHERAGQAGRRNTPRRRRPPRHDPLCRPKDGRASANSWSISSGPQSFLLHVRPNKPLTWWYAGNPQHSGNSFTLVRRHAIENLPTARFSKIEPEGYVESKPHFGGMKFADPHPFVYPTVTVEPENGKIVVEVSSPTTKAATSNDFTALSGDKP